MVVESTAEVVALVLGVLTVITGLVRGLFLVLEGPDVDALSSAGLRIMGSVELHIQLLREVLAVGAVGLLVPPVSASAWVGTVASLV